MDRMGKSGSDKVTIKIPRPLYLKIGQVIEGAGYNSVTDFVVYVLRDLVASHGLSGSPGGEREDTEVVKHRLRTLGYLGDEGVRSLEGEGGSERGEQPGDLSGKGGATDD